MGNLQSYKNQLDKVQVLVSKLEAGTLSKQEITELESLTRLMHEKSIILKYKVFANEPAEVLEESEIVSDERMEEILPAVEFEEEDKAEETEQTMPLFDWAPESDPETVAEVADNIVDETEEEVEIPKSVASIIEDVLEEVTPISVAEIKEEVEIIEEQERVEAQSEPPVLSNSETSGTFLDQMNISDSSLHTTLNGGKLDSLIGAFGLNEKLRYINDLFDGSSEMFGNAIKILDSQPDLDAANQKVNEIAEENSWDPEEEAVVEFLSYVNRRYA
ncbi:MAG: hypothetical protein KC454_08960 [Flavobacteriales bacterium]|nr:hypothetical protein [Flavobacteriales bacterium]